MRYGLLGVLLCGTVLAAQTVTVDGDVPAPLTLTIADLAAMPRETATLAQPQGAESACEGVALTGILKKAGVPFGKEMRGKALAGYLLAQARDGYQVVFSLGELDPELGLTRVMVADRCGGKPLSEQQGPVRLIVSSDKRPARSVRMVETLRVVRLHK